MTHAVKGFGIVNKAETDIFLELSYFFNDPADIGNLIFESSAFSKISLYIRKFTVHVIDVFCIPFIIYTADFNYALIFYLLCLSIFDRGLFSFPLIEFSFNFLFVVMCLVTQSCLTLWNPMDCSLPASSIHGDSPENNTGVSCHAFLQGIFPIQGSNSDLPHYRCILYCFSHQESTILLVVLLIFDFCI